MTDEGSTDHAKDNAKAALPPVARLSILSNIIMAPQAGMLIFTIIAYVAQAFYFVIVSNVNDGGYQFKQWLSFIA